MIEGYFDALEKLLRDFPVILSYTLTKKLYNTFPHHKHVPEQVEASAEPSLRAVLLEISRMIKSEADRKP